MSDHLAYTPDAQINRTIALLAQTRRKNSITKGRTELTPGAWLDVDPQSEVSGSLTVGEKGLLQLSYSVKVRPKWLSLSLKLGKVDFAHCSALGIAVKTRSAEATSFHPCLRSAAGSGYVDCFFDKHVVAYAESSVHVGMVNLAERADRVPTQAAWRDLILFFSTSDATLDLQDLRVFIV